jgi:hypothetical protein
MAASGRINFGAMDAVVFGRPAAEVVAEEARRMLLAAAHGGRANPGSRCAGRYMLSSQPSHTSATKRMRFSSDPPYRSERRFDQGDRICEIR